MAGWGGAQLGNIKGFRQIHLEQRALAEGQRKQVASHCGAGLRRSLAISSRGPAQGLLITVAQARSDDVRRRVVPVQVGEPLLDLGATAVAMHVAKSTDIHENVEA